MLCCVVFCSCSSLGMTSFWFLTSPRRRAEHFGSSRGVDPSIFSSRRRLLFFLCGLPIYPATITPYMHSMYANKCE